MTGHVIKGAGPGRPKGSKDKLRSGAKKMMHGVFEQIGGEAAAAEWARDHPTEFYKLFFQKMVPNTTQIQGDAKKPLLHVHEMSEEQLVRIASGCG